jgi:hypothetical protein
MRPRLNVTEAERLCYSRRKLQAISTLRNAGLDPTVCGLHKDYRVPGMRGRVYLVQHPGGIVYAFATLPAILRYAAERQAGNPWRSVPAVPEPKRVGCAGRDCAYYANVMVEGQPYCRGHAYIYEQILLASGRRVS